MVRGGHRGQPGVRGVNARESGTPGQRWGDFGGVQGHGPESAATGRRVDYGCPLSAVPDVQPSAVSIQVMSFVCPE